MAGGPRASLSYGEVVGEPGGNDLCFYNQPFTYEHCCLGDSPAPEDCFNDAWSTPEFCCRRLAPLYQQCFERIEARVEAKVQYLQGWGEEILALPSEAPEASFLTTVEAAMDGWQDALRQPILAWSMACSFVGDPLLWSRDCECCAPPVEGCEKVGRSDTMLFLHTQCCYPVYARQSLSGPDERLEAAIQAHLGDRRVSRRELFARGPGLEWRLSHVCAARGCVVNISREAVETCDPEAACVNFDCSYLEALKQVLTVIQHNPAGLPDVSLVLNAGDVSMDAFDELPVFTRTGTRWTNTIALPFEWQMHPDQCHKHVRDAMTAGQWMPWEDRKASLIWRGSTSNCHVPGCRMWAASESPEAMEACGRPPPGQVRDCTWNATTWLRMPRGRLVWLTRTVPFVDARFVLSPHLSVDPELVAFLGDEGLLGQRVSHREQAGYKYAIAVEGDSAADRLYWQLFTGSVVLLPDGPWQTLAVTALLEPWVHYVPVRYDLGDVVERLLWLREHDDEARLIARNAKAFAMRYLSCNAIVYYVDRLLRAYAERLEE